MAVHIFDLDGTLVKHGTNDPLPGAVEMLRKLKDAGDTIVIITRRGDKEFEGSPKYGKGTILNAIRRLDLNPYQVQVVMDCDSPRILYNDEGCEAVKRETNQGWE